jgi:hypothetical protein
MGARSVVVFLSIAGLSAHLQHVIGVLLAFTSLGPRGTVLVVVSVFVELFLSGDSTFLSMAGLSAFVKHVTRVLSTLSNSSPVGARSVLVYLLDGSLGSHGGGDEGDNDGKLSHS